MNKMTRILSPVLAAGMGLSLFFATLFSFDTEIGHFDPGVPFVLYVLFIAASLGFTVFTTVKSKNSPPSVPSPVTLPRVFTAYAAALVALVVFGFGIYDLVNLQMSSLPGLAELVTLPGLAAFFIYSVSGKSADGENGKRGTAAHAVTGLLACLSVNAMLFKGYFDFTLPLNSPIRNSITLMEAAFLFWLLSETKTIVGKNTAVFSHASRGVMVTLTGGIGLGLLLVTLVCPAKIPDGLFPPDYALATLAAAYAFLSPAQKSGTARQTPPEENAAVKGSSDEIR